MHLDEFRHYCLEKPGVEETLPFGPSTLVMKVGGKMFALTGLDEADFRLNLKCDPLRSDHLREEYPEIIVPGWHMNKTHWNTVHVERGNLATKLVEALIDHSYQLIVAGLPKKVRDGLADTAP